MNKADTDTMLRSIHRADALRKQLDDHRPLPLDAVRRLQKEIRLRHTYHTDAIEGNTLTLNETRLVVEEGITISGKPLKDHIEARNGHEAFGTMMDMATKKERIGHVPVQKLHEAVTRGVLHDPGRYRTTNVRITGSTITPPPFIKVVKEMDRYFEIVNSSQGHPVEVSALIHHGLVRIHPFTDGNGRVARLLMNLHLMSEGYPPIVLRKEDRKRYYLSLRRADGGDLSYLTDMIAKALQGSLLLYLSALSDDHHLKPLNELSKGTKYSQEYLSLRARQGRLDAVKIDGTWYSSNEALKSYLLGIGQYSS
ncbi:MAG: Fic family protein [Candidatus Thermoplasmatota archaeon]|nr:Fic family protein [Candidatus Thermoplasmatota archaeon]